MPLLLYSLTTEALPSTYSPETNYGYRSKQFLGFILVERGADGFYNFATRVARFKIPGGQW
jgi:hypothetical protein